MYEDDGMFFFNSKRWRWTMEMAKQSNKQTCAAHSCLLMSGCCWLRSFVFAFFAVNVVRYVSHAVNYRNYRLMRFWDRFGTGQQVHRQMCLLDIQH